MIWPWTRPRPAFSGEHKVEFVGDPDLGVVMCSCGHESSGLLIDDAIDAHVQHVQHVAETLESTANPSEQRTKGEES